MSSRDTVNTGNVGSAGSALAKVSSACAVHKIECTGNRELSSDRTTSSLSAINSGCSPKNSRDRSCASFKFA